MTEIEVLEKIAEHLGNIRIGVFIIALAALVASAGFVYIIVYGGGKK